MSEELLIRHCSPTLAGIKIGNLFTCPYHGDITELRAEIRSYNRRLSAKGVRILPLLIREQDALIYVYRPSRLHDKLSDSATVRLLQQCGYCGATPKTWVAQLSRRIHSQKEFPHEIGLFLGYPLADVCGFMEHKTPKHVGIWKVYDDVEQTKQLFRQYRKCTAVYKRCLQNGQTIDRLTVFK